MAALLRVEKLPEVIWEPAAGRAAIGQVLRDAGHTVVVSDIRTYDFAVDFKGNFRASAPSGTQAILTNPPFRHAAQFVAHALKLCPRIVMLCRLALLETTRRTPILDTGMLARVHVFKERLPMMHRDGWTGRRASSAIPFAWLAWNRDHTGPAVIDRISWRNRP